MLSIKKVFILLLINKIYITQEVIMCFAPCNQNEYKPVCGKKGVTYKNSCIMTCENNDTLSHVGNCKVRCFAPCDQNEYKPVCAISGKTYQNSCIMFCENSDSLDHDGPCKNGNGNNKPDYCKRVRCGFNYIPVCGKKNVTYQNKCTMECIFGDRLKHNGECNLGNNGNNGNNGNSTNCNRCIDKPIRYVCGKDGRNYNNSCYARCHNIKVDYKGKCRVIIKPPNNTNCNRCVNQPIRYVCGKDGRNYDNRCYARCHNIKVDYKGKCRFKRPIVTKPLIKPFIFNNNFDTAFNKCNCFDLDMPVCGENNITYPNLCEAKCKGVSVKSFNAC